MVDLIKLLVSAGNGGYGRVSFRREKFVPKGGPDGGYGGDGGSVYLEADSHVTTLSHFYGKKQVSAQNGEAGGKRQRTGAQGEDVVIKVPIGTVIWLVAENSISQKRRLHHHYEGEAVPESLQPRQKYFIEKEGQPLPFREQPAIEILNNGAGMDAETAERLLHSDSMKGINVVSLPKVELITMSEEGQRFLLCQGGRGGRGNMAFKGPSNTTPYEAEYGTWAEEKIVLLELKLLADVGFVGLPNAGKSTLLSVLTKARPKIASYPFTTLEPQLGVMSLGQNDAGDGRELVLADIPGLIEGASQGKGLGHDFLRHIEHCRALVFVLAADTADLESQLDDPTAAAEQIWQVYQQLQQELKEYRPEMMQKRQIIVLNKIDIYTSDYIQAVVSLFTHKDLSILPISAATKQGLAEFTQQLSQL